MNKSMKKQGHCWPAVAILLLLLAALALPSSAAAATGKISGTVKDSSGNLLQDVDVYVARVYDDHTDVEEWKDFTDEYGTYTATIELQLGELGYKVLFKKTGYIDQWYNNAPQVDCAEPVTLTDGGDKKIDAVLKEGTSSAARRSLAQAQAAPAAAETSSVISGSVSLNGEPLKCAQVEAYDAADDSDWIDQVLTDYQGNYTINELPSGSYKILFYDQNGDAGQWYNRKAEAVCADAVSETASGIDAAFPVSLRQCGDRPTILPAIKLLLN